MDLFEELEKALLANDFDEVERLRKRILLDGRDIAVDKDFIESVKGNGNRNKTLYVNLKKAINGRDKEDWIWYAKIVSSLITHILIESQVKGRGLYDYPIIDLYSLLGDFVLSNKDSDKSEAVDKCIEFINDRYFSFIDN